MAVYLINTDRDAHLHVGADNLWFEYGMAFAGDRAGQQWQHANLFRRLDINDILLMYRSRVGLIGHGVVMEPWDGVSYEGPDRLVYAGDGSGNQDVVHEYRVPVC
jgi:hypothetical protein